MFVGDIAFFFSLYHKFVNISTISQVRICRETRKDAQSAEMHLQNFVTSCPNHAEGVFICAKRNFIGRKPTSLRSTSFVRSATSFICASSGNDVLASLEMMLPLRANDVVPAAQIKNPKAALPDFWLGQLDSNQRVQESKSCALPTWRYPNEITYEL